MYLDSWKRDRKIPPALPKGRIDRGTTLLGELDSPTPLLTVIRPLLPITKGYLHNGSSRR